jgi:NAD(P)-dependent dehydrogenase (short-subunit alcohol dehydrogenase family)
MLSFAGRSAIITGGCGALGKAYALDLAKRGCNIVLNDIPSSSVEAFAKELINMGVKAFANVEPLSAGDRIVEDCLKRFGKCDILINNAGNLRDKSFSKMTKEDWQSVLDVHLHGSFSLSHAAWPHMVQQKYGRIINIGSGAGLYGNFGQANYSSAKMALLGLTNTLAKEGEKNNVFVNCVVPVAKSKMTENLLSPEVLSLLEPSQVAPIVTLLVHESSKHNGECFEVGGGWFSKIRIERSAGQFVENSTAEALQKVMSKVSDFSRNSTHPTTAADAMQAMMLAKENLSNPLVEETSAKPSPSPKQTGENTIPLSSDKIFESLQKFIAADPTSAGNVASQVRAKILFAVSDRKGGSVQKRWLLSMKKDAPPSLTLVDSSFDKSSVSCTLIIDNESVVSLMKGNLSPEYAYMRGFLKIDGQMGAAMKLRSLLELTKKML